MQDKSAKNRIKGNLLLLITALIWGTAFVAQSAGMAYVGPFTFNTARSFIGFIVLIPVALIFRRKRMADLTSVPDPDPEGRAMRRMQEMRTTLAGGIVCGLVLGVASAVQQVGISRTTAGKAGFLTALYIVIVPLLGIFIGKRIPKLLWVCVLLALAGFYFLSIHEGFTVSSGDLFCLSCAFCYSVHILVIDHYVSRGADPVTMSCLQFLASGLLSLVLTAFFETPTLSSLWDARLTLLYTGALSSGVAFTLQIIAQKYTAPTVASLIMSLESVFAALFGWLILHERLNPKELLGCALVFAAVILSQLPGKDTA